MSVRARIDELERRSGRLAGTCHACGADDGHPRTVVTYPGDPGPDPSPCARCGRGPVHVRVVYADTRGRRE